mmetsp:Transcript_21916/g.46102  ORF Transcript_21916/g.46102 Transcript_21916/m.46102 type:complete len:111 (-) Transcript_21916:3305-3637(-)
MDPHPPHPHLLIVVHFICSRTHTTDPFFMDEEEKSEEQVSDERVKMAESQDAATLLENSHLGALLAKAGARSATDGKGPTPKESNTVAIKEEPDWEWDGTVDEDAHLGFD